MRRSVLMPVVMAIVFVGAAVPAMTQVQLTGAITDTAQTVTATGQDLLGGVQDLIGGLTGQNVTGILVDSSCYTLRGKTAMGEGAHEKCAIACAQKGHRLAVVTDKGEVYMVIGPLAQENNAKLIPFINKTVVVAGDVKQVVIQDVTDAVQTVLAKPDKRRPSGNEDGVTPVVKKGDARQGDVLTAAETVIVATGIDLAKTRLLP